MGNKIRRIRRRRGLAVLLAFVLSAAAVLGGCGSRKGTAGPTTAAPYEEGTGETGEHYREDQLKAQSDFDARMEELFRDEASSSLLNLHFLLRDPEALGISEYDSLYGKVGLSAMAEAEKDQAELKEELESFDTNLLTESQKRTKRVLLSYLNTEERSRGLGLYSQPLSVTIGVQAQLPILLAEYVFTQRQDVEDYLRLLGGIDEYYGQLLDFQREKAEAGLMMSDTTLDHVIESCESYLLTPGDNFMVDTFNSRLEEVPGLTEEEKEAYRRQNEALLESDFVPAYQLLIDGLKELRGTGVNDGGLCGFPQGKEYYEYLVYAATGTSYDSVDSMLDAMEEMVLDQADIASRLMKEHPELEEEFGSYHYRQTEPEGILEELKKLSEDRFPALPECRHTFKAVPKALEQSLSPAFYLTTPLDDIQNNVIYINGNPQYEGEELFNVIAHEGYPGHLYQTVYFYTHCDSNIRKLLSFKGYSEGWATYVEQLSYTMDNGISPELGQLLAANSLATLGIHACLDVYINYLGWSKDQVEEYLELYFSYDEEVLEELADSMYQAMIENPANYLSYFVGCLEIMNMRSLVGDYLDDPGAEKAFHTFLLDMGDAPFDVIQAYFTRWLVGEWF